MEYRTPWRRLYSASHNIRKSNQFLLKKSIRDEYITAKEVFIPDFIFYLPMYNIHRTFAPQIKQQNKMVIRKIKFSYVDRKTKIGPYIDFITQLTVADTNYDTIVAAITKMRKDIEIVQLISISK